MTTSTKAPHAKLRIAAAANLKFALDEMAIQFHNDHPEVDVEITYGASGNLVAQIIQQAPFDLFMSADSDYPKRLIAEGLTEPDSYFHYANGALVLCVGRGSTIDLVSLKMDALLESSVHKIAIPNPKLAPYGRAAEEALRNLMLLEKIESKLVNAENISQALQFVDTGNAEIGFNALSMVISPQMQERTKVWRVPADYYAPIQQSGVILKLSSNKEWASRWREFVMSEEGQAKLASFGYGAPDT